MAFTTKTLHRPAIQLAFSIVAFDETEPIREIVLQLDMLDGAALIGDCALRRDADLTVESQLIVHGGTQRSSRDVVPEYEPNVAYLAVYRRGLTSNCEFAGIRTGLVEAADQFVTAPSIKLKYMQATLHHVTVYQVTH